jgi:hypothetical protein
MLVSGRKAGTQATGRKKKELSIASKYDCFQLIMPKSFVPRNFQRFLHHH